MFHITQFWNLLKLIYHQPSGVEFLTLLFFIVHFLLNVVWKLITKLWEPVMFRFFGSLSITDLTQPWIFPFWNDQYLFVKLLIENNSTKQTNVIKSYNVECISPKCKKVEVVKINVTDNDEAYIAHPSGKRLLLAKQVHERFSSKDFLQTDLVLAKGDKYIQYICLKVNNLPLPSVIQITIQDIHNHLYKAKIKIPKRYRFRFAYIQRYE